MSNPPQFEFMAELGDDECRWRYIAPTHESAADVQQRLVDACVLLGEIRGGAWNAEPTPTAVEPVSSPISGLVVGHEYEWILRRA